MKKLLMVICLHAVSMFSYADSGYSGIVVVAMDKESGCQQQIYSASEYESFRFEGKSIAEIRSLPLWKVLPELNMITDGGALYDTIERIEIVANQTDTHTGCGSCFKRSLQFFWNAYVCK